MSRLLPCPSCRRHVNATDARCPFCDTTMPEMMAPATPPGLPLGRLSRVAVLAAGAALAGATAAAGCSDTAKPADGGAAGQAGTAGIGGGGARGSGGSSPGGTGGATPQDAGQERDVPIAIYAAAVALPRNKA